MRKRDRDSGTPIGDEVALRIQDLRGRKVKGEQPLLRIDNRKQAARMPYQFDAATGRLHRRGCRAIPDGSRSALYGVERMTRDEQRLACPVCKPSPADQQRVEGALSSDLMYGFLSILDQFGAVLRERGREYRNSRYGRQVRSDLADLYASLGEREQDVLDVVASALDGLVKAMQGLGHDLSGGNGNNGNRRRR